MTLLAFTLVALALATALFVLAWRLTYNGRGARWPWQVRTNHPVYNINVGPPHIKTPAQILAMEAALRRQDERRGRRTVFKNGRDT